MKQLLLLLILQVGLICSATSGVNQSLSTDERSDALIPLSSTNTPGHKSMLVEGRTWWYYIDHYLYKENDSAEFGFSIGEEVEIDGVKWHKIEIVAEKDYKDGACTYVETPVTVAYMCEEGDKVYTAYFDGVESSKFLTGLTLYFEGEAHTELIFEYKNIGDTFIVGSDDTPYSDYEVLTIHNITQVSNSGNEYTLYDCWDTAPDRWPGMQFIEGLGSISNLFFEPLRRDITSYMKYNSPQLRYVTAPDGTIIYEGIGGYKQWEESSVGNITVEGYGDARWYNLQGVEIESPSAPGIYIRRSTTGPEKLMIR